MTAKNVIAFVFAIVSFIGVFWMDKIVINWIVIHIFSNDLRIIMKIVLWILAIIWTTAIAVLFGYVIGIIVRMLLD
jgi:hypothetical protein